MPRFHWERAQEEGTEEVRYTTNPHKVRAQLSRVHSFDDLFTAARELNMNFLQQHFFDPKAADPFASLTHVDCGRAFVDASSPHELLVVWTHSGALKILRAGTAEHYASFSPAVLHRYVQALHSKLQLLSAALSVDPAVKEFFRSILRIAKLQEEGGAKVQDITSQRAPAVVASTVDGEDSQNRGGMEGATDAGAICGYPIEGDGTGLLWDAAAREA